MKAYDFCEPRMVRLAIDEMKMDAQVVAAAPAFGRLRRAAAALLSRAAAKVAGWQDSIERQRAYAMLQRLDDRALADIGLGRGQVLERLIAGPVRAPAASSCRPDRRRAA